MRLKAPLRQQADKLYAQLYPPDGPPGPGISAFLGYAVQLGLEQIRRSRARRRPAQPRKPAAEPAVAAGA